jgi:hypothetical protein
MHVSSTFILSSNTTDGSSTSSAVFDRPTEEPGNNAFAVQLKKLYRGISALEAKILDEDADKAGIEDPRVVVHGRGKEISNEDLEVQKWNKLIGGHKRYVVVLVACESFWMYIHLAWRRWCITSSRYRSPPVSPPPFAYWPRRISRCSMWMIRSEVWTSILGLWCPGSKAAGDRMCIPVGTE